MSVMQTNKTSSSFLLRTDKSQLTEGDLYLFNEGRHFNLYEKLGSHLATVDGQPGTFFAVWAPNAERVFVMGDFNGWNQTSHPLHSRGQSGIWEGFVANLGQGAIYKYHIQSHHLAYRVDKADPFACHAETPPRTGSVIWDLDYEWNDQAWMAQQQQRNSLDAPVSVYEMHLGSWRRGDHNRLLTYREIAPMLAEHMLKLGFTHVEFLPVMEHPFYGSWGYQTTGYFAPTSRQGTPQDFMYLVDYLHQQGLGVILDWVPSHFPGDEHGLAFFDGTHLFEHADLRQGFHPDWSSYIFNYGRNEVRSFLISSAMYWLDKYHADGLRVDAVASMLYLDYSRKKGEWIPNEYGGRENLAALSFLRQLNEEVYRRFPATQTMAEESTSWPMVSRPTYLGGLGFGWKWDMGWMHDTLVYFSRDPIHRRFHHDQLTFRMIYAFNENFILALSHDEVVHGKGSLMNRMPGDDWQKFANLRLLFGYMYGQPGKKLLFMGGEIAQWQEWKHDYSLEWNLLDWNPHRGMQQWVADLNNLYRAEPALHDLDHHPRGFQWIDASDSDQSVLSFLRVGKNPEKPMLVLCNLTPIPRYHHRVGVPLPGLWRERLNSDASAYGGSGLGNMGGLHTQPYPMHGHAQSLELTLPPLGAVFFQGPALEP
jgi:1,4-alpha-glucan branching enzyme